MSPRRYPAAVREELVEDLHGQRVADPYRWLEVASDSRTLRWTAEQEAYFQAERSAWTGADRWHARLAELTELDRVLTPKVRGDRVFLVRQRADQELPVLFVRDGGIERSLLDPNTLDPSGRVTLEAWQPSVSGDRVAYQLSRDGTEDSQLHVLDVATGQVIDGPIDRVRGMSLGWLPSGEMFYYVRCLPPGPAGTERGNERRYHRRVWLHKVGSDPDTDIMVFGAGRGKTQFYSVAVTADGRWLTIRATEGTSSATEIFLADLSASSPDQPELAPVQRGETARIWLQVAPGTGSDGVMWLRTTQGAPCGRVMAGSPADPASRRWQQLIAERPGAMLTDFVVLAGPELARPLGLAARLRHSVAEISVHDMTDGQQVAAVPLPGAGTIGSFSIRPEGGHEAWFAYTDFGAPPQVMHYDGRFNRVSVWAGGGGPPSRYGVTTRLESFDSPDGTTVRMFVVSAAGRPDRSRPAILYGYGGFGAPMSAKFSPEAMAWVSAGGVFAVVCARGGGEEGEQWHRDGRGERKQNSFDDFAAAADHLVAAGWTERGQLAIMGVSNGGLLIAAAFTQHPEKYAAAVCMSPLLDMIRYELSGLGPSWVPEYGSASDPGQLRTLLSYSPYHRLRQGTAYPAVLFTVGDGDTRVDPLHARKMCAALQHASSGPGPVLFRLERGVGHGNQAASRRVRLYAESLAFLGTQLGLPAPRDRT